MADETAALVPRIDVVDADHAVAAARGDRGPVGREGSTLEAIGMLTKALREFPGAPVPEQRYAAGADRQELIAAGREDDLADGLIREAERTQRPAVVGCHHDDFVPRRGRERGGIEKYHRFGIGADAVEIGPLGERFMTGDRAGRRAVRRERLDLHRAGPSSPGDPVAIGGEGDAEDAMRTSRLADLGAVVPTPQPHRAILADRRHESAVGGEDDIVDLVMRSEGDRRRFSPGVEEKQRAIGAADADPIVGRQSDRVEVEAFGRKGGCRIGTVEEPILFGSSPPAQPADRQAGGDRIAR
jgi:hypothetical protein